MTLAQLIFHIMTMTVFYIKSYQEFCDKVLSSIKSPEQSRDDLNRMCLDSSNVSENIYRKLINQ